MRISLIAAVTIAVMTLPAHAEVRPVRGAVQGTTTVAKGVAKGTAQAGRGVARGTVTVAKGTGHGLRCIFTLGTRC